MTPATEEKAARILAEGRLTILFVSTDHIVARCRGSAGDVYRLGSDPGGWWCSCPAGIHGRPCSHISSLKLVTVLRRPT
jgi:hypothetical protein